MKKILSIFAILSLVASFSVSATEAFHSDDTLGLSWDTFETSYDHASVADVYGTLATAGLNTDGQWHNDLTNSAFQTAMSPFSTWHDGELWGLAQQVALDEMWLVDVMWDRGFYLVTAGLANSSYTGGNSMVSHWSTSPVPVPGAVWLFGTAMVGLITRKKFQN
jgi:hypothetical protein